jgi:hypothetical protein
MFSVVCMLLDHFGRDHHEALIRQLFHIRQSGSVAAYVEQFFELVDQLAMYDLEANPLYYAMRFVDGLKEDIKSIVMIQHPTSFDSACALALVQEEAVESSRKKDYRKSDSSSYKGAYHSSAPSMLLSSKFDKGSVVEKGGSDLVKLDTTEDKLWALKQYRRAKGL